MTDRQSTQEAEILGHKAYLGRGWFMIPYKMLRHQVIGDKIFLEVGERSDSEPGNALYPLPSLVLERGFF